MNQSIIDNLSKAIISKNLFPEEKNEDNKIIKNPNIPKLNKKKKKKKKKKQKRCAHPQCRNKLSAIDLLRPCKCQLIFCSSHRIPSQHLCTFDYKLHNQKILEGNNPTVNFTKINKI